jgi:hypothetical protein
MKQAAGSACRIYERILRTCVLHFGLNLSTLIGYCSGPRMSKLKEAIRRFGVDMKQEHYFLLRYFMSRTIF